MPRYWLDLFTPETWTEAGQNKYLTTGFRQSRWSIVSKIRPGDRFVCYLTRIKRFCGILEATSHPYQDEEKARQIWKHDFFPCLVDTKPVITMDVVHSVPREEITPKLSIAAKWGGLVRGSPVVIPASDGDRIAGILEKSKSEGKEYPIKVKTTGAKKLGSTKQVYGTPIDFRGLRHAPLNEQGVVYVFALIARDIGFTVEAIGTSFPDCDAKRQIDTKGEKWQRVKIEFEYASSEFKKHGHPVDGCDLIVCWKHDWLDCPIEVIELCEEIKKLGALFEVK